MPRQARFKNTGKGSFYGELAYASYLERHPNHFLVALNKLFDWEAYSAKLLVLYKGRGREGRPPYEPGLVLKLLLISYLYNVSEREVERLADENLMVKWFLGLAVDEAPPDHSTLTAFKERLLKNRGWETLQSIFDGMLNEASQQGIQLGKIQVLDSVHTQANVNPSKDRERQDKGQGPRDPDARVVNKGQREVVEPDGQTVKKEIRYRGYKTHVAVDAQTGIVTSMVPAPGDSADNKAFAKLLQHDQSLDLPTETYGGDRAYDDTDIFELLESQGLHVGIKLRGFRTTKKDANKERWTALKQTAQYQAASKVRYRVERTFAQAKDKHGFERCRYVGSRGHGLQAFLTFMVVNAKRIVKLLTGITFRELAKGRRAEVVQPV